MLPRGAKPPQTPQSGGCPPPDPPGPPGKGVAAGHLVRRGLQPRAVGRGGLGRRRRAHARGPRQHGDGRRVLVGAARAGGGPFRVRLAGRHAGPAARERDTGHPGHADRLAATVVHPGLPGRDAGHQGADAAMARQPGHVLRRGPGLPAGGAADRGRARRAVRRPSGAGHVARAQRVRHPLLVRSRRRGVPRLAAGAVRRRRGWPGRGERGVGHRVLEPALLGLGADPAAPGDPVPAEPGPGAGLPPVLVRRAARRLHRAAGPAPRHSPGVPVTTNFMGPDHLVVDAWSWGREVDAVAVDHYLAATGPAGHADIAFCADWARGVGGGGRGC